MKETKPIIPKIIHYCWFGGNPLDDILERGAFAASPVYKEILDSYKESSFVKPDSSLDLTTVVTRVSNIFKKHGLKNVNEIQEVAGVTVYPAEYFCPKNFETGELHITENTRTIHWFDGSWMPQFVVVQQQMKQKIYRKFGKNAFSKVIFIIWCIFYRIRTYGLFNAISHYLNRR